MSTFFALMVALAVFILIVWIGFYLVDRRDEAAKRRALAMVEGYASRGNVHEAIVAAKRDESIVRRGLLSIATLLTTRKGRERIARMTLYSGKYDPLAAEDVLTRKVVFLVAGLVLGYLIGLLLGGIWWLAIPVMGIVGFFVPDLLIYNEGLKRDEEMGRKLPDALDMLNLCVESGLSFQAALAQVAANQTGPVAEEFGLALKEMQVGRSRSQALISLGERTRQADVKRFVNAMLQVDKLGVPVAAVLREQANEMRAKRYARAREQAQKVPLKILMPLMLCFLPALFVILLGPAAYSVYQIFSGGQ